MTLYIKGSCDALTDGKLLAVGPNGFTLFFKGLMYSKQHLTDGFIPEHALPLIGIGVENLESCVERMIAVGLWSRCDGGVSVTRDKWAKHQTTRDEVEADREANRVRKQRQRERERESRESEAVTEKSRRDTGESHACGHGGVTPPETETETETGTGTKEISDSNESSLAKNGEVGKAEPKKSETPLERRAHWNAFCEAYPKREGGLCKAAAETKFAALLKSGVDGRAIVQGAENLSKWAQATGKVGTSFVPQMTTWLNQKRWLEEYHIPEGTPPPAGYRNGRGEDQANRKKPAEGLDYVLGPHPDNPEVVTHLDAKTKKPFDRRKWYVDRNLDPPPDRSG